MIYAVETPTPPFLTESVMSVREPVCSPSCVLSLRHTLVDARGALRIRLGRGTHSALLPERLCCAMLCGERPWQQIVSCM